ncbi:MAG: hypothetical protein CL534_01895 [Ahrensia sp.]|nr:hypothetical protein [Ahrensia sp.]
MRDIELLLESQTHWERAIRKDDVPTANRYALRMTHAVRRLRETEAGRTELEKLLTHPKPNLRLWAAGSVEAWAPDLAVPVLARLLYEPLEKDGGAIEDVGIRMNAQGYLAEHFGLHPSDLRELPRRLADMGIDLPEETARQLRWEQ